MSTVKKVYNYTGAPQTFVVPEGTASVRFECYGASGGVAVGAGVPAKFLDTYWATDAQIKSNSGQGSNACGYVAGTLPVVAGDSFDIYVGGNGKNGSTVARGAGAASGGAGGWNGGGAGGLGYANFGYGGAGGGGGGGMTDVRVGVNRILVAGGAGGSGGATYYLASSWTTAANPTTPVPPYYLATRYLSGGQNYGGSGGYAGYAGAASPTAGGGGGGDPYAGHAGGGGAGFHGHDGGAGAIVSGGSGGPTTSADATSYGVVAGGGGGGGGYWGGGGGGAGAANGAAGGGGGSNRISDATELAAFGYTAGVFSDTVSTGLVYPPSSLLASGYGGFAVLTYEVVPHAPVFVTPTPGEYIDAGADLDVTLSFSSDDPEAVFSKFDLRYQISPSGAWTTLTDLPVSGSIGTHVFPGGTFPPNSYDIEARVYDTEGSVSGWTSVTVISVDPPPTPVITTPVGGLASTDPFTVTWTQSSGDPQVECQVQILDSTGAVVFDTGTVVDSIQHFDVTWSPRASQDGLTLKVRYAVVTDIWSGWTTEPLMVNIDPPGVPVVIGTANDDNGSVFFRVTAVDTPHPTTTISIYRQDLTHDGAEIRVAAGLIPDPYLHQVLWTDYTPANRTRYRYRFRALSASGGFADA